MGSTFLAGKLVISILSLCTLLVTTALAAPPTKETPQGTVTQNWDKNLPSVSRFIVLAEFGGAAVRDNNTGLVWEQTADGTTRTQPGATIYCANKIVGGTTGWRLPSVIELSSALDTSVPNFAPPIFSGVNGNIFWSATTNAEIPTQAWTVSFSGGGVVQSYVKGTSSWVWCVRGPMNADAY